MSEKRTVWAVYRSTDDYYEQHPELIYLVSTKEEAMRIEASDPELWAAEERVYDSVFIPGKADGPVHTVHQPQEVTAVVDWVDRMLPRKLMIGEVKNDGETISTWGDGGKAADSG